MRIKVKERGAGWTKSCGSGAIAAAALALDKYYQTESYYGLTPEEIEESYYDIQSPIFVEQEGGVLEVHHDDRDSLKLVGPSEFEYDGVWSA
jgi:diaminopimelate epimerase